MKLEEIKKLEQGTLIKIKGNGFFGKVNRLVRFDIACARHDKGYMLGCTLYPFEWITLATKKDYQEELNKAREDYERRVQAIEDAWAKAQKYWRK